MPVEILSTLDLHVLALRDLKDRDKVLRGACLDGLAAVSFRIQQQGRNSKSEQLKSYSDAYAKLRKKAGRQTSKVDLTFTGQMMGNFTVLPVGSDGYGLGFNNDLASAKAGWNEERYGVLFVPTKEENDTIIEAIEEMIIKILNRR